MRLHCFRSLKSFRFQILERQSQISVWPVTCAERHSYKLLVVSENAESEMQQKSSITWSKRRRVTLSDTCSLDWALFLIDDESHQMKMFLVFILKLNFRKFVQHCLAHIEGLKTHLLETLELSHTISISDGRFLWFLNLMTHCNGIQNTRTEFQVLEDRDPVDRQWIPQRYDLKDLNLLIFLL